MLAVKLKKMFFFFFKMPVNSTTTFGLDEDESFRRLQECLRILNTNATSLPGKSKKIFLCRLRIYRLIASFQKKKIDRVKNSFHFH